MTYLLSSPEELASVLLDEKQRHLWDFNVKSAEKVGDDCLKVTYYSSQGKDQIYSETIKYDFYIGKSGKYFISEAVNGEI